MTTVTFSAVGAPRVAKGMRLVMQNGERFVVVRQTASTVTLVPERWWHRIPWWGIVCLIAGVLFSRLLVWIIGLL